MSYRHGMFRFMSNSYFTPQLFAFLRDLANNNDREWFKANQKTYEAVIREPALDFINDFAAPLARISPHFVADSRTVGGSLFRIQRDTRFSKEKRGVSYKGSGPRLKVAVEWSGGLGEATEVDTLKTPATGREEVVV